VRNPLTAVSVRQPEMLARPAGHCYQVGQILLFLKLVLLAATSLRAAAAVLKLLAPPLDPDGPHSLCEFGTRLDAAGGAVRVDPPARDG
jgi:hypothetical protein